MSVLILVLCWIFTKKFSVVDCAPKIGHVLFDPLAYETNSFGVRQDSPESSDSYLSDDRAVLHLRTNTEFVTEPRKPCHGYEFDENKCTQVNGRLLCGYDKNVGEMKHSDQIIDLGNGCRQRGDRIECGYINGPFDIYPRRPSIQTENNESSIQTIRLRHVPTSSAQDTENPQNKMKAEMTPELKKLMHRVNFKANKNLETTLNEPKAIPTQKTQTTLVNLVTTQASTVRIISTTTNAETTKTTNAETSSARALPPKTDSVTIKDKSTRNPENNSTLLRSIISIATSNTTISSVRTEKTETTDVSPTSTPSANLSTKVSENTDITQVPTYLYNLPKVETLREILKLSENHTRRDDDTNTNTGTDTPVLDSSNTTMTSKTVCVEKGDRIVCYDFNI